MINLSSTVYSWYVQKTTKIPKMFDNIQQNKISIHRIINLNAGIKNRDLSKDNTVSLLKLVRKNGRLTRGYLESVSDTHKLNCQRILRKLLKSQKND